MATVQLKPDYAASEVYSTASEPPPVSKPHIKIPEISHLSLSLNN